MALERQPMSNFKLSLYQDLSEEEEENGKGTNEEEEKDGSLSGLDNDDDLSDTNSDLPLKIRNSIFQYQPNKLYFCSIN